MCPKLHTSVLKSKSVERWTLSEIAAGDNRDLSTVNITAVIHVFAPLRMYTAVR